MADPRDAYLDRLRQWRNRPQYDQSLQFIDKLFKRQVARPYKQLASLTELWARLVPAPLLEQTRLEGMSHGVLHVSVQSSAALYELSRLLREGLQRQLITEHKGPALRRVQLKLKAFAG